MQQGVPDYKRCPQCLRVVKKTARICPFCEFQWVESTERGTRRIPKEKAGELKKVKKTLVTIEWKGLIEQIRLRAGSLKAAIEIARHYGYRHTAGWTVWKNILKKY